MCDINLRDVDEELVRRAKMYAAGQGITLKAFVVAAIEAACLSPNIGKALEGLVDGLSKPGAGPGIQRVVSGNNGHAVNCRCLVCKAK